jgi:hypothetical protein
VLREAANRVTIDCWYQRHSVVQLVSILGGVGEEGGGVQVGRTEQHLDISYKNIKHAFFQPAENAKDQCVTLIHFNLVRSPLWSRPRLDSRGVACTESELSA